MVDIIYRNDDDLLANRHKDEELIELPSGARQRKRRILDPKSDSNMDGQTEIRQRRNQNPNCDKNVASTVETSSFQSKPSLEQSPASNDSLIPSLLGTGNLMAGLLVMIFLSYHFASYLYRLHENDLWFSEIMVCISTMLIDNIRFDQFRKLKEKSHSALSKVCTTPTTSSCSTLPACRMDWSSFRWTT